MFRKDSLTVKRNTYEVQEGAVVYSDPETIYENIPCHLAVSLNNTFREKNIPCLNSEFELFLNYDGDIFINPNDILIVNSANNQEYKLYAGEVKIYGHSIQIKCTQEKIIESDNL